jgi:hypothetical protein
VAWTVIEPSGGAAMAYSSQAGNDAITLAAVSAAITLVNTGVTTYRVFATPSWNTGWWITARATTSFTIQFSNPAPAGATLDWAIE